MKMVVLISINICEPKRFSFQEIIITIEQIGSKCGVSDFDYENPHPNFYLIEESVH